MAYLPMETTAISGCCVLVVKIRYSQATLIFTTETQQAEIVSCCENKRVSRMYLIFTTGTQQPEIDSNILAT